MAEPTARAPRSSRPSRGQRSPGRWRRPASPAARGARRTLKIVVFSIVFYYFALPALGQLGKTRSRLSTATPLYLALGFALELTALLAYSQLMRVTLPRQSLGLFRLFRINLATKSLNNLVPGGSAAGSALAYRLLVTSGIDGADAGFAIAATGIISAVVLNLALWIALLLSLPFYSVNVYYLIAVIAGAVILAFAGFLVLALMRGLDRAHRILRAITRRLRFVDSERAAAAVEQMAVRLREIISDRELVARAGLWATLNWLLDAAALWAFIRAFADTANLIGVLVAFGLTNVLAVIPITPGGLGIVEAALPALLVGFGVDRGVALLAVPAYRVAQFWLPIPLGGIAYLTVRRDLRPVRLRDAAAEAYSDQESMVDWVERYGRRRPPDYV